MLFTWVPAELDSMWIPSRTWHAIGWTCGSGTPVTGKVLPQALVALAGGGGSSSQQKNKRYRGRHHPHLSRLRVWATQTLDIKSSCKCCQGTLYLKISGIFFLKMLGFNWVWQQWVKRCSLPPLTAGPGVHFWISLGCTCEVGCTQHLHPSG